MPKFVEWSDIDKNFRKNASGEIGVVEGEDAINQSIKTILSIRRGQKVRSDIGSSLYAVLFEPMSEDSSDELQSIIETNLERWENRINVSRVRVVADVENHYYRIEIRYTILRTREKKNLTTFVPSLGEF